MRKKRRVLFILLALLFSITACRKSNIHPAIAKLGFKQAEVNLGTHKLAAFSVIKNSKYLIVFESGLGDDHAIWNSNNVALTIAAKMDIVTYDRANRGLSEDGPVPRDVSRLESELNGVIGAFANGRKVVLIGHSLGGFMIQDWAIKNPTRVAGLLFVDASHEAAYDRNTAQAYEDYTYADWNSRYGPDFGATLEAREWVEDLQYMSTLGNLPDVPVIVLTAMKVDPPATIEDLQPWYDAQESLKNGVTDFTHIRVTNSGHMMMIDAPQTLINYINVLIAKLP